MFTVITERTSLQYVRQINTVYNDTHTVLKSYICHIEMSVGETFDSVFNNCTESG